MDWRSAFRVLWSAILVPAPALAALARPAAQKTGVTVDFAVASGPEYLAPRKSSTNLPLA